MAGVLSTYGQYSLTDSVRHVDLSAYAGVLAGGRVSVTNAKLSGTASFRAGGTVAFSPARWFSSYGLGAFDADETGAVTPLYLLGVTFRPVSKLGITIGKIATPMTELRPLPTTMAGQFEPWTKSRILGSALGGKVRFAPTKNVSLVAGGFLRGTDGSVELGLSMPHFQMAGYCTVRGRSFGVAATATTKWATGTVGYNHRKDFALFANVTIPKTGGLSVYSDVGFDPAGWKLVRGEWGILYGTQYRFVRILTGCGYSQEARSAKLYVMLTL